MAYLIGTDEAGYGPNLGPLVVSASVWSVPDDTDAEELSRHLAGIVSLPRPGHAPPCVTMGDSKILYHSGHGLGHLEAGLWAAMAALGRVPQTWRKAWDVLAPGSQAQQEPVPWYADYDCPLPLDADCATLGPPVATFGASLRQREVELVALRAGPCFPTLSTASSSSTARRGPCCRTSRWPWQRN